MARSDDPLRAEYAGVDEVLGERLLATAETLTLHLPAHDREGPACHRHGDGWRLVDVEGALAYGGKLCRSCFRVHLEHLARDTTSPVEHRADDARETPSYDEIDAVVRADGGDLRVASLTEEVGRSTGGGSVYHVPTGDGSALCGVEIDVVDERELVESHFRPCSDCFDLDAVAGEK